MQEGLTNMKKKEVMLLSLLLLFFAQRNIE